MTGLTGQVARAPGRRFVGLRDLVRTREGGDAWAIPAFLGVTALAAVLYLWNLAVSGYANEYYAAAAQAASQSWSAFFFGSLDAGNFITVDKPPLGLWLMGLAVRLFGLSSWSILLPQALLGVATVAVLFVSVRRSFGTAAATIASVVMALTPAATLIFRFDNPDALLTFFLVASAAALLRALEDGSLRWAAFAGALIGLGFLTKYMQAYLVLPGFAFVWLLAANGSIRRRAIGLAIAAASVVVGSGWWVAIVQMIPLGSRPFIGGSTSGSPLDLIFGYDGFGRLFGASPGGGAAQGGGGFGGSTGILRMLNGEFFGEIAWFLPPAVAALVYGVARRGRAPRTDPRRAALLLWGSMLVVQALVFSFMSGVIHSYYVVVLAPPIGALVGAGLVDLWGLRAPKSETWIGGLAVGAAIIGMAAWGAFLLGLTPSYMPQLGAISIAIAAVAAAILAIASLPQFRASLSKAAPGAAALGIAATLAGPAAYASTTISTAYSGGDPHPGAAATSMARAGFGGVDGGGRGGFGTLPSGTLPGRLGGETASSTLTSYLLENRGTATWIVAVSSANSSAAIQLATGLPVMAMGGFTGSDPVPTLDQLKAYFASGRLRFILATVRDIGGGFGGFGGLSSSGISSWVTSNCTLVDSAQSGTSNLYDCAGAAS